MQIPTFCICNFVEVDCTRAKSFICTKYVWIYKTAFNDDPLLVSETKFN